VEDDEVFDASPIGEEAICLAVMAVGNNGAQFRGSIMVTEIPWSELLNAIYTTPRKSPLKQKKKQKKRIAVIGYDKSGVKRQNVRA
jgi:hypothetical protein